MDSNITHMYMCVGIHHCLHPSVVFALVNHTEQRMTHSGRGYLQPELISGPHAAATAAAAAAAAAEARIHF